MKILYDCFSCSPYYGSDEGIGWTWPYLMSQYHEVWAIVRSDRREDIERFCKDKPIHNLNFVYCDVPKWMNIYYYYGSNKTSPMRFLIYQYMWQYTAVKVAKRLHKEIKFDLVHHVCTNDFRLLGFMYKLKIPFIIGPIGGAQETPPALRDYIKEHQRSEQLRRFLNKILTSMPSYKKALSAAKKIYVSNRETQDFILQKINAPEKVEQMTEVAYLKEQLPETKERSLSHETVFMWAGRMEYRKGIELLLDASERLPLDEQWRVLLCGDGREKDAYMKRVAFSPISDRVVFTGKLPYDEIQTLYDKADAFVFPSLRETTGTVIIEAMAHAVPVICLNQGGGAYVVNDECGWLIDGKTKEEYIENFANAMLECITNQVASHEKGKNAWNRILGYYTWEQKIKQVEQEYHLRIGEQQK